MYLDNSLVAKAMSGRVMVDRYCNEPTMEQYSECSASVHLSLSVVLYVLTCAGSGVDFGLQ
eukprot:2435471-Rhodomonas_salina.1